MDNKNTVNITTATNQNNNERWGEFSSTPHISQKTLPSSVSGGLTNNKNHDRHINNNNDATHYTGSMSRRVAVPRDTGGVSSVRTDTVVRYTKRSTLTSLNQLQKTYPWLLVQLRPNQNPLASCAVCQKYWFYSTRSSLKNPWVQGNVDLGSCHRKSKLLLHEKSELHSKCVAQSLKAGPSNQGYSGKPENSRRKKIATATVSSETVLIPDDSPPQPTAPKLQKKQLDERRFDERRFDEQRFQERRFENRRFEERRQMVAAQSAQVAAPPLQVPTQMQVPQHLQVTAPPPAPAPPPPRQVQVLAPPVQVPVAKPKPVEKPRPREKRIFVVADHQRCVMSNLSSLWKSGKLCDAGIGNGSSTVMVHKVVLSAVCPKLLSVFSTDILSHKFLQVNFPEEVSTEALNAFAEYMYNGILDLDRDILEQLKIIAKRLDMKEFEQLCDSHLPNHMHQPAAAAVASFTNVPLIQTSMQFPSMTSSLPSLSSTISAPVQSAPSITTQVIDVKQEISEAELAQVRKDTAAVFGQESEVASLAPNKSGNTAGFVICPSVKTEPVGPEDDKYGHLSSNTNNQTFTSTVPSSSSSSSHVSASTSITSVPASQTEFAIPFSETTDVKSTKLKSSHSYESPLVSDLSPVSCIVETVCSQSSHMNEDSSKTLSRQAATTSSVECPSTSTTSGGIYPVGLFTAGGDNLPLLTTQTVDVKSIDLYKTDLT